MPLRLEWQHDHWDEEPAAERAPTPRPWRRLLLAAVLLALIGAGAGQAIGARQARALAAEVQALLDAQQLALARDDVNAFQAYFLPEPGWQAVQLDPERQAPAREARRVIQLEADGEQIWGIIAGPVDDRPVHTLAFFSRVDGALRQAPPRASFWGDRRRLPAAWGDLVLHRTDVAWAEPIAAAVETTVRRYCRGGCITLTVEIADDFAATFEPNHVRLPSPRLVGMTPQGEPDARFWALLQAEVTSRLTPATLRFAVPDDMTRAAYSSLAEQFNRVHSALRVEVVTMPNLLTDPAAVLATVDGALLAPDAELITRGHVLDLTDFAADPRLDNIDFYAALWDGGWWRERLWQLPLGGEMPLLFVDKAPYAATGRSLPALRWTWPEMDAETSYFAGAPASERQQAALLDLENELTLARAYATDGCFERCAPLTVQALDEARRWQAGQRSAANLFDTTALGDTERQHLYWNLLSSRRQVVMWVDTADRYEYHYLLDSIAVRPFPTGAEFAAPAPLHVRGAVISRHSARPLAAWQWLRFLSYEDVQPNRRLIPARPSVAAASAYWETLPTPLNDSLRAAFPFARAVTIADRAAVAEQ